MYRWKKAKILSNMGSGRMVRIIGNGGVVEGRQRGCICEPERAERAEDDKGNVLPRMNSRTDPRIIRRPLKK